MDTDGFPPGEAAAAFVVTHTSGDEVVVEGYATWEDASVRAEEVHRRGAFPVTVDSTGDGHRWAYGDAGELEPVPGG